MNHYICGPEIEASDDSDLLSSGKDDDYGDNQ